MTTTSSSDPPTSPLFRLSAELLDHILSFVVPSSPRLARRTLARLLLIHSSLVPLIRRRLYARISLTIGSSSGSDLAFLSLLRDGVAGLYVRVLRLELPKPDWSVIVQDRDPAEFLVARPVLDQKATVERVREVFERTPYVRNVEVDVQLGVPLEWVHHRDVKGEKADKEAIALEKAMAAWTSLEGFVTALPDAKQRLQIWSDPTATSHFVHALTTWSSLTTLDLWRVRLVLPCDDTSLAFPTFALGELNLRQVELGDELELKWFLGEAGGVRSSKLKTLRLNEVDFVRQKDTNATLLSIFPADRFPSFASTLDVLDLTLSSPIPSATAARFARFSNLKELTLAGPGVDLALCEAFFGVGEDSVKTKSTDTPAPLSSLRDLAFHYLPHPSISIPALASLLCPATTSSTTTAPPLTSLTDLRFHTTYPLPRTLDWRTRRLTREPVWSALADDEVGDEGWREVFRCAGRINRARRRAASGRGESGVVRRVRVWQNRFEMGYDDDVESEGEEGEDEDEEEGAASEVDMNALFVPASGSEGEEENAAWVRRTLQDEEDEDDF